MARQHLEIRMPLVIMKQMQEITQQRMMQTARLKVMLEPEATKKAEASAIMTEGAKISMATKTANPVKARAVEVVAIATNPNSTIKKKRWAGKSASSQSR